MRPKKIYKSTIFVFCLLLGLTVGLVNLSALAQGTSLSLEGVEITAGDEVTVFLNLDKALDGLGRLDASIISSDPDIVELTSITPQAVSEQFLQIDTEKKGEIAFKMVDLGNKIDPGDQNI